MNRELEGKIFLVTGATEGIGKAATKQFAERGANLTLVARNREKGEALVADLTKSTGNSSIRLLVGDMSSIKDIRRVANEFRAKSGSLDVLVNNAGAVFSDYKLSADGYEMTFALNHIGYFGVTSLLLDLLQKSPKARVVSTSSAAHMPGKIDLDTIAKRPSGKAGFPAYCDSKLANILFTRELARKLKATGGVANCFHPGVVNSGFGLNNEGFLKVAVSLFSPIFGRSPEKGAETLVWLATDSAAGGFSGEYFHDKKISRTSKTAKDDELASRLWSYSESLFA